MTKTFESCCEDDTFALAKELAESAGRQDIYALIGDLGAGKTAFAKGFAAGLGVKESVVSPTFTLVQIYESGRMPLYHFDVYRIGDISEMDETGYEDCFYGEGVTLVEWADLIRDILPEETIYVTIERKPDKGSDHRKITIVKSDEDNSH